MSFETMYSADARGKSFAKPEETEYYQPRIDRVFLNGKDVYFVRETHGYYDDQLKKAVNRTDTLNPDEGFATWQEAKNRYDEQMQHRASQGFKHVFTFDPFSPNGISYRVLP